MCLILTYKSLEYMSYISVYLGTIASTFFFLSFFSLVSIFIAFYCHYLVSCNLPEHTFLLYSWFMIIEYDVITMSVIQISYNQSSEKYEYSMHCPSGWSNWLLVWWKNVAVKIKHSGFLIPGWPPSDRRGHQDCEGNFRLQIKWSW